MIAMRNTTTGAAAYALSADQVTSLTAAGYVIVPPATTTAQSTAVDTPLLSSLTRQQLNDYARIDGILNPEQLPSSQAVIDAIRKMNGVQ